MMSAAKCAMAATLRLWLLVFSGRGVATKSGAMTKCNTVTVVGYQYVVGNV